MENDFVNTRLRRRCHLATELACLSEQRLSVLLDQATPVHTGIGGTAVILTIDGTPIFVKKIPLTDLEWRPENIFSTANLFKLPLCYQYGVGSTGFGVWRELLAHEMTTNWVLSGECANFPIMYHWRALPDVHAEPITLEQKDKLEQDVGYWEHSQAIRNRLEALQSASVHLYLFLEYVPQNLFQWFGDQLKIGGKPAEQALSFVISTLKETCRFMNERDFVHFDAHFHNILTDGQRLYFSDFGLALSTKFDLSAGEAEFLNTHRHYDLCSSLTNLLHCIVVHLLGEDGWHVRLTECLRGEGGELPPAIAVVVKKYAPIAFEMDAFYRKLQEESKEIPYPAEELEELLALSEADQ